MPPPSHYHYPPRAAIPADIFINFAAIASAATFSPTLTPYPPSTFSSSSPSPSPSSHRDHRCSSISEIPRLLLEKTIDNEDMSISSGSRRYGTRIHKRVNTIVSIILGDKTHHEKGKDSGPVFDGGTGNENRVERTPGSRTASEVFELCKKRILMGKKCRTLNRSGKLLYDANGVLIVEDLRD